MSFRISAALYIALGIVAGHAGADAGSDVARETRPVSGFSQVVFRAPGDLVITQGDRESLVVEAEQHLQPQLVSKVENGVLVLSVQGSRFQSQKPVRFLLTVKDVSRIADEGAGTVTASALRGDSLKLVFAGSGSGRFARLELTNLAVDMPGSAEVSVEGGRVTRQIINIGGAGQYAAAKMASTEAKVVISGSGDIALAVERKLAVQIEGSGMVRYVGNPQVTQDITGAGDVERVALR